MSAKNSREVKSKLLKYRSYEGNDIVCFVHDCVAAYPIIQMEFILFGVAVQFGNFVCMRIGVTVYKIQVWTFQIAAILNELTKRREKKHE